MRAGALNASHSTSKYDNSGLSASHHDASSRHADNSSCSELSDDETPLVLRLPATKRLVEAHEGNSNQRNSKKGGFVIPRKKRQKEGKNLRKFFKSERFYISGFLFEHMTSLMKSSHNNFKMIFVFLQNYSRTMISIRGKGKNWFVMYSSLFVIQQLVPLLNLKSFSLFTTRNSPRR